jgi:hypothetical protein
VFSNQVNIVCVSTELKTSLATLAYDFCTGESFAAETNLRASGFHVKRFLSKRNGQTIKLNTFLITFNFPTILSSIRMDHYNVKVSPYVLNPIRCFKYLKFGHGKGKLKWFKCSDEDHEGFDCNNHPKCSNCGTSLATLAYDFCTGESFAAETNLRASGYDIFFSDLTFFYLFFFQKIMTIFRWSYVSLSTIGALRMVITIEALVVFIWTFKSFKFPFTMSEF